MIHLGYLEESNIRFPPHEDPPLDTQQLKDAGLDETVIDLLRQLPLPRNKDACLDFAILPITIPYTYLDIDKSAMNIAREPMLSFGWDIVRQFLDPCEVLLGEPASRDGMFLILDVQQGVFSILEASPLRPLTNVARHYS